MSGSESEEALFFDALETHVDIGDITATYDEDEDPASKRNGSEGPELPKGSVMTGYLNAIQRRLKDELSQKKGAIGVRPWLLQELKKFDWMLPIHRAGYICNQLGINYYEIGYYRNVYVWFPEDQWGNQFLPPCPNCRTNDCVKVHAFPDHVARHVFTLQSCYYIMTKRYKCTTCFAAADAEPDKSKKPSKTFMGWDERILPIYNYGRGYRFPAYFTHRSGIDKSLLDLLRALTPRGIRPETFSDIMTEVQGKEYTKQMIDREYLLASGIEKGTIRKGTLFSSFCDKVYYNGLIPTGKYFQSIIVKFGKTIRSFQDNEMKKLLTTKLHFDTSYHLTKMIAKYHGLKLFDGLLTATNETGHVRIQALTHGEGHDQCRPLLKRFVETQLSYGHPLPTLASSDKPASDCAMLQEEIRSLEESQARLDALLPDEVTVQEAGGTELPTATLTDKELTKRRVLSKNIDEISNFALALTEMMMQRPEKERVLSLDTEADCDLNPVTGKVCKKHAPCLLQIGYRDDANISCGWLIQLSTHKDLPAALKSFLMNDKLKFCGVWVGGDIKELESKFQCALTPDANIISLGKMARERGTTESGTIGMDALVRLVLKERMNKDDSVRLSKWSRPVLRRDQEIYATLDVIKPLDVYFELAKLTNLAARLTVLEASKGTKVDIFPTSGSVVAMASVAAVGFIKSDTLDDVWHPPACLGTKTKNLYVKPTRRLVRIEKVFARGLKVPYLSQEASGDRILFGDLADVSAGPFDVILPVHMLANCVLKRSEHSIAMDFGSRLKKPPEDQGPVAWVEPAPKRLPVNPYPKPRTESTLAAGTNPYGKRKHAVPSTHEPSASESAENGAAILEESHDIEVLDMDQDVDYSTFDLSSDDIKWITFCLKATGSSSSMQEVAIAMDCPHLNPPPAVIKDVFKSVTGDGYHFMERPPVPVRHSLKKAYKVALMEAWYSWNPEGFNEVVDKLKAEGKSDEQIEAVFFFNTAIFLGCVGRTVPRPSVLYWRVRAVFAFYGVKVCSHTGKPLFNETSWKKANNVLEEILKGYASDVPGETYYRLRLNDNGDIIKNRLGIPMIDCCRGTSDVEAFHRWLRVVFRNWEMGLEMLDCLLAEVRHRYNHRISERKIAGFPKIGHFDTWLVDLVQNLVARNHGIRVYPNWSNASEWAITPETFGLVPMHGKQLGDSINCRAREIRATEDRRKVALKKRVEATLTRDMKFSCQVTRLDLPCLPVYGEAEHKLFSMLIRLCKGRFDEDEMAMIWVKYADGKTIFPKLPLYLRWHHKKWLRNEQTRVAVKAAAFKRGDSFMKTFNKESAATLPAPLVTRPLAMPATMTVQLDEATCDPSASLTAPVVVGGTSTTVIAAGTQPPPAKRSRGSRGIDAKTRKPRSCARCRAANAPLEQAQKCAGNGNRDRCWYYNEDGTDKWLTSASI